MAASTSLHQPSSAEKTSNAPQHPSPHQPRTSRPGPLQPLHISPNQLADGVTRDPGDHPPQSAGPPQAKSTPTPHGEPSTPAPVANFGTLKASHNPHTSDIGQPTPIEARAPGQTLCPWDGVQTPAVGRGSAGSQGIPDLSPSGQHPGTSAGVATPTLSPALHVDGTNLSLGDAVHEGDGTSPQAVLSGDPGVTGQDRVSGQATKSLADPVAVAKDHQKAHDKSVHVAGGLAHQEAEGGGRAGGPQTHTGTITDSALAAILAVATPSEYLEKGQSPHDSAPVLPHVSPLADGRPSGPPPSKGPDLKGPDPRKQQQTQVGELSQRASSTDLPVGQSMGQQLGFEGQLPERPPQPTAKEPGNQSALGKAPVVPQPGGIPNTRRQDVGSDEVTPQGIHPPPRPPQVVLDKSAAYKLPRELDTPTSVPLTVSSTSESLPRAQHTPEPAGDGSLVAATNDEMPQPPAEAADMEGAPANVSTANPATKPQSPAPAPAATSPARVGSPSAPGGGATPSGTAPPHGTPAQPILAANPARPLSGSPSSATSLKQWLDSRPCQTPASRNARGIPAAGQGHPTTANQDDCTAPRSPRCGGPTLEAAQQLLGALQLQATPSAGLIAPALSDLLPVLSGLSGGVQPQQQQEQVTTPRSAPEHRFAAAASPQLQLLQQLVALGTTEHGSSVKTLSRRSGKRSRWRGGGDDVTREAAGQVPAPGREGDEGRAAKAQRAGPSEVEQDTLVVKRRYLTDMMELLQRAVNEGSSRQASTTPAGPQAANTSRQHGEHSNWTHKTDLASFRHRGEAAQRLDDEGFSEFRALEIQHVRAELQTSQQQLAAIRADYARLYRAYSQLHEAHLKLHQRLGANPSPLPSVGAHAVPPTGSGSPAMLSLHDGTRVQLEPALPHVATRQGEVVCQLCVNVAGGHVEPGPQTAVPVVHMLAPTRCAEEGAGGQASLSPSQPPPRSASERHRPEQRGEQGMGYIPLVELAEGRGECGGVGVVCQDVQHWQVQQRGGAVAPVLEGGQGPVLGEGHEANAGVGEGQGAMEVVGWGININRD